MILDESLTELQETLFLNKKNDESKSKRLYSAFNWTEISAKEIIFNPEPSEDEKKSENKENVRFRANSLEAISKIV